MKSKITMFTKVNLLVSLLLVIIVMLYSFTYYSNITVIQDDLKARNMNRLVNTMETIDNQANEFNIALWGLSADPDMIKFRHLDMYTTYEAIEIKNRVNEKLNLQKLLVNWNNDIIVYSLNGQEALGTSTISKDEDGTFEFSISPMWQYEQTEDLDPYLSKYVVMPNNYDLQETELDFVIEGRIHISNIVNLLDALKENVIGDPFIYQKQSPLITNRETNESILSLIIQELVPNKLSDNGDYTLSIEGEEYLVMYVRSTVFDWILFDYIPVNEVLSPVTRMKNLFYGSIGILLVLCLVVSLLFYRNLQKPINYLLDGMQRVKSGEYSVRLNSKKNNEFQYLFNGFNDMTYQIQYLIERVFKEQNLSNEAKLKYLQSQINPHFLYNCLFLIKNMASLDQKKSVEEMALLLGDYYRYITESDIKLVSLQEEMELVNKYINIHVFRMERFSYQIRIPDEIKDVEIPKLLVQPLVENAIVHGLEPKDSKGHLHITGKAEQQFIILNIEDDGVGIPDNVIEKIKATFTQQSSNKNGYGINNVYQRLIYYFGEKAKLTVRAKPGGGTRIRLCIPIDRE